MLFVRDLWANLCQPPEHRFPTFRRVSLISLMSPEALNRYMETTGTTTDLLIVHGGLTDSGSIYQTLAYLQAAYSMFKGFMIFEAVSDDIETVEYAARRAGFPLTLGVR